MHQNTVQVVIGTPGRLHDVFVKHANNGGLPGGQVQMLVVSSDVSPSRSKVLLK